MSEMPDVVAGNTITVAWGNQIRDRTVQRYATVAARNASEPAPADGALAVTTDTGSLWIAEGALWVLLLPVGAVLFGGAQDATSGALTTSLVDKASVVFTKPASWATYALMAWGTAVGSIDGADLISSLSARVEIGASNGATATVMGGDSGPGSDMATPITVPVFHSVTAQTATPVTLAVAVAEVSSNLTYRASTIQYVATRLT